MKRKLTWFDIGVVCLVGSVSSYYTLLPTIQNVQPRQITTDVPTKNHEIKKESEIGIKEEK